MPDSSFNYKATATPMLYQKLDLDQAWEALMFSMSLRAKE
jgi:hypothetical protein